MSDETRQSKLSLSLAAYGADVSRWPAERVPGLREELLRDPHIRREWEKERQLDRALLAARGEFDSEVGRSAAVGRVRESVLARLPVRSLDRIGWARVAAAVLIAGVLGGAMDLVVRAETQETAGIALVDPVFYGLDVTEIQ